MRVNRWFAGLPGTGIAIGKAFATFEGAMQRGHYCEFVIAIQTKRPSPYFAIDPVSLSFQGPPK